MLQLRCIESKKKKIKTVRKRPHIYPAACGFMEIPYYILHLSYMANKRI